MSKISVRKRAALKAWATRRANSTVEKAVSDDTPPMPLGRMKGWAYEAIVTQDTRHEAAVKAWETRRAVKEELIPVNPKMKKSYAATGTAVMCYNEKTEEIMVQTASGNLLATGKFLKDYKIKPGPKTQIGKIDRGCAAALKAWATRRETQTVC